MFYEGILLICVFIRLIVIIYIKMTVFYQSVKISNTIISYKDLFLKQNPLLEAG